MRVLFTIPHYVRWPGDEAVGERRHGSLDAGLERRIAALAACLTSLRLNFSPARVLIAQRSATAQAVPALMPIHVEIVVCALQDRNVLNRLPSGMPPLTHQVSAGPADLLGFACHDVLRERLGSYDFYCYLEDDLVLHDPLLFMKLAWFSSTAGDGNLLQPNRFEAGLGKLVPKVYVDGDLEEQVTAPFQDLRNASPLDLDVLGQRLHFERTLNPHSGCFFLNARQMEQWVRQPHFNDRQSRFIGPLETAATLGIMRTFEVYKPALANAEFLEIQHHGTGYLDQLCLPTAKEGS